MDWLDLVIIASLLYFLFIGFRQGFIRQFLDLIVLIFSFFLAFKLYHFIGAILTSNFNIAGSFANVAGFFVIWFLIEFAYYIFFVLFYEKIPEEIRDSKYNKWTGIFPGFLRGILTLWVFLSLIYILPLPATYHNTITGSAFGGPLVRTSPAVENYINGIFGGAINDTISFLTIKPDSNETLNLGFTTTNVSVDIAAESKMLELVNKERTSRGLKPLAMDKKLQEVARAHSKDMFARGYFAHNTPEGLTPFDRMNNAGIQYMTAGENLALAPDVDVADTGLMNSPGHKRNILTPEFAKVGIGVIKSDKYGEMFSQEFTD